MTPQDDRQIVFRRFRGRIIPIRQKRDQLPAYVSKNLVTQGIGAIATGAAIATAAGAGARRVKQMSFKFRTAAMDVGLGKFGFGGGAEGAGAGAHVWKSAKRVQKLLPGLRKAGRLGGASLIGLGTYKLIESTGVEQKFGLPAAVVNDIVATGASLAAWTAFGGKAELRRGASRITQAAITKSKAFIVSNEAQRLAKIVAAGLIQKLTGFKLKP